MRKWVDVSFAWLLVLLGTVIFLASYVPRLAGLWGPWAGGTAVAIIAAGLMNALRVRRPGDFMLRWSAAVITALAAWVCFLALYQYYGNVLHHPAALAAGLVAAIELVFAVIGR